MNKFNYYLEKARDLNNEGSKIGSKYKFRGEIIEFIGNKNELKNININSEILGDEEFKKPKLIFKWITGNNSVSSFGVKGDIVAISNKIFNKEAKKINE